MTWEWWQFRVCRQNLECRSKTNFPNSYMLYHYVGDIANNINSIHNYVIGVEKKWVTLCTHVRRLTFSVLVLVTATFMCWGSQQQALVHTPSIHKWRTYFGSLLWLLTLTSKLTHTTTVHYQTQGSPQHICIVCMGSPFSPCEYHFHHVLTISLASSPGSTQLFNVIRRLPLFSVQHWNAGWSLGMRLPFHHVCIYHFHYVLTIFTTVTILY